MATTIEARFRIATPMFCGGADPKEGPAELRLPSFKGTLRFWWRALAWAKYNGDLGKIQEREDYLFGSAGGGQARVILREVSRNVRSAKPPTAESGQVYLAGQGLARFNRESKKVEWQREAFVEAGFFTVEARFREASADDVAELRDALTALGLLGGLGARSRRGFGSLVLESLDGKTGIWGTLDSLSDTLCDLLEHAARGPDGFPPYTAFSRKTRLVVIEAVGAQPPGQRGASRPAGLHEQLGREFLRYRAWGFNGKVLGKEAERNFTDDHNAMDGSLGRPEAPPRRAVFGLPHNYQFRSTGRKVDVTPTNNERRASPLFFHVNGPAIGVVAFLPATFLPRGEQIRVTSKATRNSFDLPAPADSVFWKPVDGFLDRLLGRGQKPCVEKFGKRVEVKP